MGRMKEFLIQVSVDMGFHGEINDEVIEAAQDKLAYLLDNIEEKEKFAIRPSKQKDSSTESS
jgi:hypothetical protein